jgi:hypothetical protein
VFGRVWAHDTTADPIVRVTAAEIRKRIAQYYQDPGHTEELKISLPPGSYVPHFSWAKLPLPVEPSEPAEQSAPLPQIVDQPEQPPDTALPALGQPRIPYLRWFFCCTSDGVASG